MPWHNASALTETLWASPVPILVIWPVIFLEVSPVFSMEVMLRPKLTAGTVVIELAVGGTLVGGGTAVAKVGVPENGATGDGLVLPGDGLEVWILAVAEDEADGDRVEIAGDGVSV